MPHITYDDLLKVFSLGIETGDTVLVHAALKPIGWLVDGPDSIIRALQTLVGSTGNILMLTASRQFRDTGYFDVRSTPSDTGYLSEVFRNHPDVQRSCNPMVSFAAVGPAAAEFLHEFDSYLDDSSPFTALLRMDGKILLYGVSYDKCTLYHLSEERTKADYNFYKTFRGTVVDYDGAEKPASQTYFVRRDMSLKKDARPAGADFERSNKVIKQTLGNGMIRIFKARDFDQHCMDAIRTDPAAFLAGAVKDDAPAD